MPALTVRPPSTRRLERGGQAALIVALLALATVAWWATDRRMSGMSAAPGAHLGPLGFYLIVWVTMMAAMMFPSLAPMVVAHARIRSARVGRHWPATAGFLAGYLAIWAAYGVTAYVLWQAGREWLMGDVGWQTGGRWLAGGAIVAAAIYQLTPAKDVCLSRCRGPFAFLTEEWREGTRGALAMGALHGGWCVGCCWALMVALFALGVMSVGWMVFIAVLIAAEKLLAAQRATTVAIACLLVLLGVGVAVAPGAVPGLVEPSPMTMP